MSKSLLNQLKKHFESVAYPDKPKLPPTREAAWNRVKGLSNDGKRPPTPTIINKRKTSV